MWSVLQDDVEWNAQDSWQHTWVSREGQKKFMSRLYLFHLHRNINWLELYRNGSTNWTVEVAVSNAMLFLNLKARSSPCEVPSHLFCYSDQLSCIKDIRFKKISCHKLVDIVLQKKFPSSYSWDVIQKSVATGSHQFSFKNQYQLHIINIGLEKVCCNSWSQHGSLNSQFRLVTIYIYWKKFICNKS
jgi:hypothetical protein